MKAMIMAAGLGTRLKPWTLEHPKALVPVGGVPMLERVVNRLKTEGFDQIVVNVHHFADQVKDYLRIHDLGVDIRISDETELLLDTGGALVAAAQMLTVDDEPFLVHNVDILSNAPLGSLMSEHISSGRNVSLITSDRASSRRLIFDADASLCGWHNLSTGQFRPEGFVPDMSMSENAFSGIYFMDAIALRSLSDYARKIATPKFPIMDWLLSRPADVTIGQLKLDNLNLIDIGKPETLKQAQQLAELL